jgi:hypothetical protein
MTFDLVEGAAKHLAVPEAGRILVEALPRLHPTEIPQAICVRWQEERLFHFWRKQNIDSKRSKYSIFRRKRLALTPHASVWSRGRERRPGVTMHC